LIRRSQLQEETRKQPEIVQLEDVCYPLKDHSTRMRIKSEDLTIIQFIVVVDSSVGHTESQSHGRVSRVEESNLRNSSAIPATVG